MKNVIGALTAPFNLIRNKFFFMIFLNGFILALLVYFYSEDNYETQILKALSEQVMQATASPETDNILIESLHLTHNLEQYRLSVFGNKKIHTLKSDLIRPVTFDLMTGNGACGSYSYVLSRLLNEMSIETRFAQMKVDGVFGGHILVEARSGNRWIVLDPSYDMAFKRPDGAFASFQDVKSNWKYYQQQVPADYNLTYNYSDVQYTNWNKIPVVMPALKGTLSVFLSEKEVNEFSIRNVFLRKFNMLFKITSLIYLLFTIILVRIYFKQSEEVENFRLSLLFPKKDLKRVPAENSIAAA